MLWTLAFDRLGVAISDLYFVDPNAAPGSEGAERGVRLELRRFHRDELLGSVYSAVPIRVGEPIWRLDLLETVESEPGSLDRAHHHPRFRGWEPGRRVFDEALSADPVDWTRQRFEDVDGLMAEAEVDPADLGPDDVAQLKAAGPMIVSMLEHLMAEVSAGRAGLEPPAHADFVRQSWL